LAAFLKAYKIEEQYTNENWELETLPVRDALVLLIAEALQKGDTVNHLLVDDLIVQIDALLSAELDKIRAVFNIDSGAHPPLGFAIHGRQDLEAISKTLLKPLAPLGADRVFLDADFDSDQETFIVAGLPIYSLRVDPGDYDTRHHTIIDTFERVDPRMLAVHTAVMAVAGYSFANAEQRPGRRLSPAEVQDLLKRTGLEQLYQLEYSVQKPQ